MSNPFAFPCAANKRALIYFGCGRTRTIVQMQQWLAGFCMKSGPFFKPRGLSNCFSFSHLSVMRLGCILVTSCQEMVMLRRLFQRTPRFRRFKSLSEQRTTLRLVFVGDRSLTCLSNVDRKTITRTQNGGSTLTYTHTHTHTHTH